MMDFCFPVSSDTAGATATAFSALGAAFLLAFLALGVMAISASTNAVPAADVR